MTDHKLRTTTPKEISPEIEKFAARLSSIQPFWINLEQMKPVPYQECFLVVGEHVKSAGGSVQHGWTIWEWPGIVLEAEFHAVWKSPDGNLIDICPKMDGESRILFVPDPVRVYEGERLNNRRTPLSKTGKDVVAIYQAFDQFSRGKMSNSEYLKYVKKFPKAMNLLLRSATEDGSIERMMNYESRGR